MEWEVPPAATHLYRIHPDRYVKSQAPNLRILGTGRDGRIAICNLFVSSGGAPDQATRGGFEAAESLDGRGALCHGQGHAPAVSYQ